MDTDLPRLRLGLLSLIGFITGLLTATLFTIVFAQPAHAASETRCAPVDCYVDSTVRSESNWADEPYTSSTGETVTPGSGSSNTTPKYLTTYVACSSWHNANTKRLVLQYPYEESGAHRCWFPDRTMTETDTCPPRPDRAANGRVDYYIERQRDDGERVWLYARFKCLYPTDEHAPIARLDGSGKVYTSGQAWFYQTSTTPNAAANTTYGSSGTLSNTSGHIDRGVDLTNPERYIGSWQPAFTAQTLSRNGQPVYGYYRLDWRLDYRLCERWVYPAWLGAPNNYDCSQQGTDAIANPYTYACNFTPPLTTGVRADALFVPNLCNPQWECAVTDDYLVGGQDSRVVVLRNGEPVPVQVPQPSASGAGISNPRSWQVQHTITPGSTPDEVYARGSWEWEKWGTYSRSGTVSFNWASEDSGRPFSWSSRYRFTADFYLPVQHGDAWQMEWVLGNASCPQNPVSPEVEVVRSVNR